MAELDVTALAAEREWAAARRLNVALGRAPETTRMAAMRGLVPLLAAPLFDGGLAKTAIAVLGVRSFPASADAALVLTARFALSGDREAVWQGLVWPHGAGRPFAPGDPTLAETCEHVAALLEARGVIYPCGVTEATSILFALERAEGQWVAPVLKTLADHLSGVDPERVSARYSALTGTPASECVASAVSRASDSSVSASLVVVLTEALGGAPLPPDPGPAP